MPVTDDINDDNAGSLNQPTDVLLWLFIALTLGILTMQLLSIRKNSFLSSLPYTVVVFLVGVAFAAYLKYKPTSHGESRFDSSILDWVRIDADLMLFVFLPPLVFGEAMDQNIFHMKKSAGQSFLLAVPGVIMGCFLQAIFTKLILPEEYHWSWMFCCLFGAILSATDTVAVLSLLHSAATSPKLTVLIVGESLANDASSMILFTLFLKILNGHGDSITSPAGMTIFFMKTVVGSFLVGFAFGYATYLWLRTCRRPLKEEDTTAQIAITLCSAYLSFYTSQYVCQGSGVLSVCTAGLVLAWLAPPIVLQKETMNIVWGFMTWIGNTLIFLLSGLIIGNRVLAAVAPVDWLYMILLYVMVNIVRCMTVAVLFPWLSTWGSQCSLKEALFISWAGLRGALSMALALIVSDTCCVGVSSKETSRMFFYVGGIASLTLVVNGGLARALLDILDLVSENSVERTLMLDRVSRRLARKLDRVVDDLGREMSLLPPEVLDVKMSSITLLRSHIDREEHSALDDSGLFVHHQHVGPMSIDHRPFSPSAGQLVGKESCESLISLESDSESQWPSLPPRNPRGMSLDARQATSLTASRNAGNDAFDQINRGETRGARSLDVTYTAEWGQTPLLPWSQSRNRIQSRAQRISSVARMLQPSSIIRRGAGASLMPDLLGFVRGLFLDIVRTKYWDLIESSKLPRTSYAVRFLLYSVDVGQDVALESSASSAINAANRNRLPAHPGDWAAISAEVTAEPFFISALKRLESGPLGLPSWCGAASIYSMIARWEARRDKRNVYILGAFIEAHKEAARKLHSYLGDSDAITDPKSERSESLEDNISTLSLPEAVHVKKESAFAVEKAQALLDAIPTATVNAIKTKQCALSALAREAEMVIAMVKEGLITDSHAEVFLDDISSDRAAIESERRAEKKREMERERHSFLSSGSGLSRRAMQEPLLNSTQ